MERDDYAMPRVLLAVAFTLFVVVVALAGCSSSPKTIPATIDNGATQSSVSGVRCVPHGQRVTVTGTLRGGANAEEPGVQAIIYDSSGKQIGLFGMGEPVLPGHSQGFTLTVSTTATPARCVVGAITVGGIAR
jgi:hypothetical protein